MPSLYCIPSNLPWTFYDVFFTVVILLPLLKCITYSLLNARILLCDKCVLPFFICPTLRDMVTSVSSWWHRILKRFACAVSYLFTHLTSIIKWIDEKRFFKCYTIALTTQRPDFHSQRTIWALSYLSQTSNYLSLVKKLTANASNLTWSQLN